MIVEIECGNSECPKREYDEDEGREVGHKYLGNEVPATRIDPSYIEGECPYCGEETTEYEVERLTPYDIEQLRYESQL